MTDRELLEFAARAAGLRYSWYAHGVGPMIIVSDLPDNSGGMPQRTRWNPLDDDGDALRLAAALRLNIDHNQPADQQRWVAADRNGCEGCYAPVSCVEDAFEDESHRMAATRRAIVRAAAEIGRQAA